MRFALAALFVLAVAGTADAATITGTVTWSKSSTLAVTLVLRDRHVCPRTVPAKQVEIDRAGRVARAVVWIEDSAKPAKLAKRDVTIDQRGCLFAPVSEVATVGSTLVVGSSDEVLHNVHIKDEQGTTLANVSMPVKGQVAKVPLVKTGIFSLRCGAGHDWMRASIVVLDHARFDLTKPDGSFELRDVAPGSHRVIAFHPELGRVEKTVVVGEGPPVRLDFDL